MRCGGSYNSVCTTTTGSRTWKRCASVSRRNGTIWTRKWLTARLVNGASNWQPALQPAEDILNFHSEHYCICSHTDWHVLNLVSFAEFRVKQIEFSCTSNGLVVIRNFRISQGSVATQLRWGGNCHHSYSDSFLWNLSVKELWKLVHISRSYDQKTKWLFFLEHCVHGNCIHTLTQTHTTILRSLYRSACDSWQSWEDFVAAKFYCPHALANGN